MKKLPQNIFYKKAKGTYVYQKRLNGKRWEWARKDLKAILEVKKTVEEYYAEHGEVPKILDPHADIDYIKELPIGKKVGEWTILEHIPKNGRIYMKCECSCGKIKQVYAPSLFKGISMSCGHVWADKLAEEEEQAFRKARLRKRTEPNENNYSTGIKNISFNKKRKRYTVSIVRFGVKTRKFFYNLDEAIEFKKEVLEAIEKNDGKIPQKYL